MLGRDEVMGSDHTFWEKCARHTNPQTARNLAYIYLCDPCADRLMREALNGRPPVFHGATREGYCGLCNQLSDVTYRQWFACQICWNVIVAYQKSIVAGQAVHRFWRDQIENICGSYDLQELDEVQLLPYQRASQTKREAAEVSESLDFLVVETGEGLVSPRFHIELKSGPGAIETMKLFQLDVNDFDDIAGTVLNTEMPAYVVHAQVGLEYLPPTRRAVCTGMWWTDVLTLHEHLLKEATRRDEAKKALYFDPSAFQPIDSFPEELTNRRFEDLALRIMESDLALRG